MALSETPLTNECERGFLFVISLSLHHGDELAKVLSEAGYESFMRSDQQIVFGHEFAGVVREYGPGCKARIAPGTPVVALPLLRTGTGMEAIGLSAAAPGAYAEQVVVEESLMLPVPNGLSSDVSALTEPIAPSRRSRSAAT